MCATDELFCHRNSIDLSWKIVISSSGHRCARLSHPTDPEKDTSGCKMYEFNYFHDRSNHKNEMSLCYSSEIFTYKVKKYIMEMDIITGEALPVNLWRKGAIVDLIPT